MSKKKIPQPQSGLRRFFWENGLSIVFVTLFLGTWIGQSLAGRADYNEEQRDHGQPEESYWSYVTSGHFWEATGENWESEFLQMGMFVFLTKCLRQKGSAESKKLDEEEEVDRDPKLFQHKPDAPWPVQKGGWVLAVYANSLTLIFLILFLVSFAVHALGGAREYSSEQVEHGQPATTLMQYLGTGRFWNESLQNWQSEFLSIAAMVLFSIWLRQKGSPESKPVDMPHAEME